MRTLPNLGDTVVDMPPIPDQPPPIPDGIMHWYGEATRAWWAVVPGRHGARLIEAPSEDALAVMVDWNLRQVWNGS
ncbi:hypothetical protein GCM10009527_009210 [Actinomadura nitritigenes]|uniref:Uncharacterized protein n=1 Tax=Actinomadura nitritigenes TaxID=134602 RepID=A0ABS3R0M6_9ACTN|nr:hypothetical protein [Actinomadura nitritigenes]MBO2439800.1 hypothetical protein [Actinomadura nitritigenes]